MKELASCAPQTPITEAAGVMGAQEAVAAAAIFRGRARASV